MLHWVRYISARCREHVRNWLGRRVFQFETGTEQERCDYALRLEGQLVELYCPGWYLTGRLIRVEPSVGMIQLGSTVAEPLFQQHGQVELPYYWIALRNVLLLQKVTRSRKEKNLFPAPGNLPGNQSLLK